MTKKNIKALMRVLESHRRRVAAERDRLREFASEVEELAETCDDANGSLQDAIDALSKLA